MIAGLLVALGASLGAAEAPDEEELGLDLGIELQAYPAGVIPALRLRGMFAPRWAVLGYLSGNFTRRGDFGEHDDERGEGVGSGVAGRWYSGAGGRGLHLGARIDLFYLPIRWQDDGAGEARSGETTTLVLQPTAQAGYTFDVGARNQFAATISFGREINVVEDGEEVGEDFILLFGLAFASR